MTQLEFELFHWHGDPEMRVITEVPVVPNVTTSCPLPVGSSFFDITCDAEGAMVAVTDQGTLLGRAQVSGGVASVILDPPPESPRELDVVITGHNLVPWEDTCVVIVPDGPWLTHRGHSLDDSAGNGDGILNPGETVVMAVTVENVGADAGSELAGVLSSSSTHCTVIDADATFPDLDVNQLGQSLPDHFTFSVGAAASHSEMIPFTLDWSASGGWTGATNFAVPVCEQLVISDVQISEITHQSALVTWSTNVPATSQVSYGTSAPPTQVAEDTSLTTDHSLRITGLDQCTGYLLEVSSSSPGCYQATDANGDDYYGLITDGWRVYYQTPLDSDPGGWYINNGSHSSDGWAFGQPTGQGQDSYGGPDPTSGYTGLNVYGVNLNGDAPSSLGDNELRLAMPSLDLSEASMVQLRYRRWLGVENDSWDNARIRVSTDGGVSWTVVWENGGTTIDDQSWIEHVVDLTEVAAGHTHVLIQWTYGSTDSAWDYCGWNIDDVVVEGAAPCPDPPLFADGWESGDCSGWSHAEGEI
jgi:hypothetical protein